MTVRTRAGSREENAASWSEVKHTTSHRPNPGAVTNTPVLPLLAAGCGSSISEVDANEGNRFSNTTTS